jgi:hypothetical protein
MRMVLILVALMSMSSQAGPYFINMGVHFGVLFTERHDAKISQFGGVIDSILLDSTMVCSGNSCKWQYTYSIDTTPRGYTVSYLTDFTAILAIDYSFFDSLNRVFTFKPNVKVSDINQVPVSDTVDSIWGDTMSSPGNRSMYARVRAFNSHWDGLYMDHCKLIGTLQQDTSISFSTSGGGRYAIKCLSSLNIDSAAYWMLRGNACVCQDTLLFPQGRWKWIYTASTSCYNYAGHSGCNSTYSDSSSLGHNYSCVFSNDTVYSYQDNRIMSIDRIDSLSLCNRTFNTSLYPDPMGNYTYAFIGDEILRLSTGSAGSTGSSYVDRYFSIDSALTRTTNHPQLSNVVSGLKIKQMQYRSIKVTFNLSGPSDINLTLYSISGKIISSLFRQIQLSGKHEYVLETPLLSNGCYLLVLKMGDRVEGARLNYLR